MPKLGAQFPLCIALLSISALYMAIATDPSPLQDFCVGVTDPDSAIFVNGLFCKNPAELTVNEFAFRGFNTRGDTNNELGRHVLMLNVTTLPSINTLGVSIARVDFAPKGVNPPHFHPRASEIFTVLEGTLYAGFITGNLEDGSNKLYATVLKTGDVFVFPQGLIHFQINIGKTNAVANVAFGSQNPGVVTVGNAVFGSKPSVSIDVLAKAFHVDQRVIQFIQSKF